MLNSEMKAVRRELTLQSSKVACLSHSQSLGTKAGRELKKVEVLLDQARKILFDLED